MNSTQKKLQEIQGLNPDRLLNCQAPYLTITLECVLCLCEAVIESYSCMGDFVHIIKFT